MAEAARETNKATVSGISLCISGKRKTSVMCECNKRFTWSDNNTDNSESAVSKEFDYKTISIRASKITGVNNGCRRVRRHAHDNTYVDFNSIAEAERMTNKASGSKISMCINGKRNVCGMCFCGERFTWESLD